MATSQKQQTRDANRSSISGRFVTEKYAQTHPKTTEHERIRVPAPQSKKPG